MTSTQLRPTRRTLVRGAAWSVPVISIAAAAPAFAASPCVTDFTYALDWGNTAKTTYSPPTGSGATKVGTASALAPTGSGAAAVGVTFTSTYSASGQGAQDRRAGDNLTVPAVSGIGGLVPAQQGLLISHDSTSSTRNGFRQEVVIHFTRAVSGLAFTITDVDSQNNGWWDQIELTGTRTGAYNNGILVGAGTAGNPWRTISDSNSIPTTSGNGNVAINYTVPVTDITLTFWSTENGGNQLIRLSDFAFSAKGC